MSNGAINELGTSRYQAWKPWMGVPVAISVGKPKWMPGVDEIRGLAPYGLRDIVTDFEFRLKYVERLEQQAAAIRRDLVRLSQKYPGQRLVLMCWEDLTRPDSEMCHRTVAAEWLREHDLEIEEMTEEMRLAEAIAKGEETLPPPPPPTLF